MSISQLLTPNNYNLFGDSITVKLISTTTDITANTLHAEFTDNNFSSFGNADIIVSSKNGMVTIAQNGDKTISAATSQFIFIKPSPSTFFQDEQIPDSITNHDIFYPILASIGGVDEILKLFVNIVSPLNKRIELMRLNGSFIGTTVTIYAYSINYISS